ncbi:MAG: hypothetical protein IMZ58_00575 [Thermoplasmata archaeon]|nr:hypothetical protein [Thermoplasmata archaeon]
MSHRKMKSIVLVVSLLFSVCVIFKSNTLGTDFSAIPSNEPEYGSWNVSEHVRNMVQDESGWVFMHPASWNFDSLAKTLRSNMSNGDYEFSAAIVNDSWANRTQSILWANYTLNSDEDAIFVGPIYACHDNGSFDMVLYGSNYLFFLSWNGTNLTNTEDGSLVEERSDALNYYNKDAPGSYPNGLFGNGIFVKTIYNALCGGLFTKDWGYDVNFMDEPVGWAYEGNLSGNIQTDDAVRWGVAWWAPGIVDSFTVDYDYMNMWRLNYSTVYDATFAPSDERPFMQFPIINMSEPGIGDNFVWFLLSYFMGGGNITDDDVATFLRSNITDLMNLESRMYHPNSAGAYSQNDTVYYYSATLTNLRQYIIDNWGDDFFPEPEDASWIPNNVLWLYVQNCPDGEEDFAGFDYIFASIDTEDDGIWDETDRAFYIDEVVQASWTGTEPDEDPYSEFIGFGTGRGEWSDSFPYIHRYADHLNYWLMIPLDWLVNGKTGKNLDIGDTFGLHIQTSSTDDNNICVWENWNETACDSFVDESSIDVFSTYLNSTDIYDEGEDEPLDLTINTTALGNWGGGGIAGDPPLPPDSYGVNITIETDTTRVSSGWDEYHDINFTVNVTNTGDGAITDILINGTWWNCSCSGWNAILIDTNIDMTDFFFVPCHFMINDTGNNSLAGGASHEFWYIVRFQSCDNSSEYRPLTGEVNVSTDEGTSDDNSWTIQWGRNSTVPEEPGTIPSSRDTDGDGLTDEMEEIIGTDIHLPDTDFDGYTDYEEYIAGSDPLDANSTPNKHLGEFLGLPCLIWIFIVLLVGFIFLIIILKRRKKKK